MLNFEKNDLLLLLLLLIFFCVGSEFNNAVVDELFRLSGVKHCISSSYHPQTNGKNNTIVLCSLNLVTLNYDVIICTREVQHNSQLYYSEDTILKTLSIEKQLYYSENTIPKILCTVTNDTILINFFPSM